MNASKRYVEKDSQGALRVGSPGVSLDSVVIAFQQGHSAETIQQLYPALSLEEVYGAIAYYLANRDEVDQYLERQAQLWDQVRERAAQNPSPVVQRLRAQHGSQLHGTMSRPRFLADNDLNDAIVLASERRVVGLPVEVIGAKMKQGSLAQLSHHLPSLKCPPTRSS